MSEFDDMLGHKMPASRRPERWKGALGVIVGMGLLGLAIWAIVVTPDGLRWAPALVQICFLIGWFGIFGSGLWALAAAFFGDI